MWSISPTAMVVKENLFPAHMAFLMPVIALIQLPEPKGPRKGL